MYLTEGSLVGISKVLTWEQRHVGEMQLGVYPSEQNCKQKASYGGNCVLLGTELKGWESETFHQPGAVTQFPWGTNKVRRVIEVAASSRGHTLPSCLFKRSVFHRIVLNKDHELTYHKMQFHLIHHHSHPLDHTATNLEYNVHLHKKTGLLDMFLLVRQHIKNLNLCKRLKVRWPSWWPR